MIRKHIFNHDVKARFKAAARDRIHRFFMADKKIKGAVVHTTLMVNEMRANHKLGPLETLILGQAYIAGALLCTTLKGKDRISINIQCSGPVKGLDVEANVFGEVKGYLKTSEIAVPDPEQVRSLSSLFGAGFLTVTKYLEDSSNPYSGRIPLEHGTIAQDLAVYFLKSEQIPTGFNLSIFFDENQVVTGAGGIFLQAMPGADPRQVAAAEQIVEKLDSIGQAFAAGVSPRDLVMDAFSSLSPDFLGQSRVEFFCRCSRERMLNYLKGLSFDDRADMLANGPFPLEVRCHHCNSVYSFNKEALKQALG
ncbi:MAG: Hsp33 family molecular chaperone HslO [Desulfotignum sp.]|nr:Hsp33 family molecular chaperone HslO [Desulfotignum sp.]